MATSVDLERRVEHAKESDPIDRPGMEAEINDPSRVLIHNRQDPVGQQGYRLTAEQIHAPEAFFHVAEESQPGRPAWTLSQPVVMGENPCGRAKVIGSAIRGRPQRGLRFFISTIEPR